MTLEAFAEKYSIGDMTEAERAVSIAYFFYVSEQVSSFRMSDVCKWFDRLHFSTPNRTRLRDSLLESRRCTRSGPNLKLHARTISGLKVRFGDLSIVSEVPADSSAVLPLALLSGTRGYLEALARQINVSYESACFDGCAVLMRRMVEILLILTFRAIGEETKICSSAGQYDDLASIINKALPNPAVGFSKQARDCIDKFRVLGNFSAHKIEYTSRRDDIKPIAQDFRALVEEMLYKAGIKK